MIVKKYGGMFSAVNPVALVCHQLDQTTLLEASRSKMSRSAIIIITNTVLQLRLFLQRPYVSPQSRSAPWFAALCKWAYHAKSSTASNLCAPKSHQTRHDLSMIPSMRFLA